MEMDSSKLFSPKPSGLSSITIFLLSILFFISMVSCSTKKTDQIPHYDDHCGSIVPAVVPKDPETITIPFPPNQDGYYLGGEELSTHPNLSLYFESGGRRGFYFRTEEVYNTDLLDVYKVKASLIFQISGQVIHYVGDISYTELEMGVPAFEMQGFWSQSTGKLCMVGSTSSAISQDSELQAFDAVLKLSGVGIAHHIASLIKGTLESLSSADGSPHFKPISMLMFPQTNYKYTKLPESFDYGCPGGIDVPKSLSLKLPIHKPICSVFQRSINSFELEYASSCKSAKNCAPIGKDLGYLPQIMYLSIIHCSSDKQSLQFLVKFPNSTDSYVDYYRSFDPNMTLVAEGSWDAKQNHLCARACRILNVDNSFDNAVVDNCPIGLSLRFPATWSVGNTSAILGQLWSYKNQTDSDYFDQIKFRSSEIDRYLMPGLKYNYTLVDRATQTCQKKKPDIQKGRQYPDGKGYEMQLSMSIKKPNKNGSRWMYSFPLFVGNQTWNGKSNRIYSFGTTNSEIKAASLNPINISYQITISAYKVDVTVNEMKIIAEGAYDAQTGGLCMVGCRYLDQDLQILAKEPMDCEIVVDLQFPPFKSNKHIEAQVKSLRDKSSPLYFDPIFLSTVPYYSHAESIWRMDFEIIMALISNTLVCIFLRHQILYLKKNRNLIPSISLMMLLVLALGQMIPLLLNFEALFFSKQNQRFSSYKTSGWVEINEVFVRLITMVSFLLHFLLLQLVFPARVSGENQKSSLIAEKKTFYVTLPIYIAGGLITFLVNYNKNKNMNIQSRKHFSHDHRSLWQDSRSYAGLILDAFLFPQILLNIFLNSRREHVLSGFFYLGMTLVRLLPHVYDLYRAHHYVDDYGWSNIYATPGTDFFSIAWDVIIPLVCLLFASLIFLQQRFGGRCFLPKRFKDFIVYQKTPVNIDA